MTESSLSGSPEIDVVITWVDGDHLSHRLQREEHLANSNLVLHENAINPHRWTDNGELFYCLRSIENFAPWVRKIWIVVDAVVPSLSGLSDSTLAKIDFVFHSELFAGIEDVLPTFNSLAIETMLWRIEGLTERFLYFNDDVFLAGPLKKEDMFIGEKIILRGNWRNYSGLDNNPEIRADPALFNHFMQINAAKIVGFEAENLFAAAHVVHPMRQSIMSNLFDRYTDIFLNNARYRFRDLNQFLPQTLHNLTCIADGSAIIHEKKDHLHIHSGQGIGQPGDVMRAVLENALLPEIKFLCVNDLPQLEAMVPEARDYIMRATGEPRKTK
ncbi:MAG: hypothetical protein ACI861_001327 [Paracoccaceae bacterium]|jgi:hypothetical protein